MICPFTGCVESHWVFLLLFGGDLAGWEALKEILCFLWYFPLGDLPPPLPSGQAAASLSLPDRPIEKGLLPPLAPKHLENACCSTGWVVY